MKTKKLFALILTCLFTVPASSAGILEKEITFSQAEVQAAIAKNGPMEKNYGGVVTVSLKETPLITLGTPAGQAALFARTEVTLIGQKPVPVEVEATAGVRYDESSKSFFLENPVVQSIEARSLPKEIQSAARRALTTLMANYFQSKPLYVLREDGSAKEKTARWLLRSVRIETGRVVATLAPF